MNQDNLRGYSVPHAPGADLDYGFDWANALVEAETITESSWTATAGITLSRQAVVGTKTSTFAAGGVDGQSYRLTNTVTTSGGRIDKRTITLICQQILR